MTIPPFIEPEPEKDEEDEFPYAGIHHVVPLKHGGKDTGLFEPPVLPTVDIKAARQPLSPGMPPLRHIPLPPPEAYQLIALPLESGRPGQTASAKASSAHPAATPQERIRFPVAEPPAFKHLKPAPSVIGQPSTPAPEPITAPIPAPAAAPVSIDEPTPAPAVSLISQRFDPFFALLIYLALGLGTWVLGDLESRYTILWVALIVMGGSLVLLGEGNKSRGQVSLGSLTWGLVFGLPTGLMLLVFAPQALATASRLLFPNISLPALFQMLAITGPLGETLFFRGGLQEKHGIVAGIIGAGLGTLVLFLPAAAGVPEQLTAVAFVAFFMTVLAGAYSYIRERYGLTASYACQVTVNIMLLFLPQLLVPPVP